MKTNEAVSCMNPHDLNTPEYQLYEGILGFDREVRNLTDHLNDLKDEIPILEDKIKAVAHARGLYQIALDRLLAQK